MQFSTRFLAVFPALTLAAPATLPKRQFPAWLNLNENITITASAWLQDTGFASSFLDFAISTFPNPPPNLAAEFDEVNHKTTLNNFFVNNTLTPNQDVVNAYIALVTQGHFQDVLNGLIDIAATGNLANVATINANRCANVLPAIDAYFNAVAVAMGQTGFVAAIRPAACGGVWEA